MANANKYVIEGDNRLKKSLFEIFRTDDKYETALELYEKAKNLYTMNKDWDNAIKVLMKILKCNTELKNENEVYKCYVDISKIYRKNKNTEHIEYLKKAIDISLNTGKFNQAGKLYSEIGDYYFDADVKYDNALDYYLLAIENYELDVETKRYMYQMIEVREKIAKIHIHEKRYDKAGNEYEKVAFEHMKVHTLRFSAP